MFNQRGQSIIEYAIFLVVFIAAMIVMATYIKRGIQGNWHSNAASLYPETYDPNRTSETVPLRIRASNYSFSIQEESGQPYPKRPAPWGGGWQVWSNY